MDDFGQPGGDLYFVTKENMGTRHLILVFYRGAYHIAQYGQWDGYPSGAGVIILAFLRKQANIAKLTVALDTPGRIYTPTEADHDRMIDETNRNWQDFYASGKGATMQKPVPPYPSISRDTGAKILELVANATEPVPIVKQVDFVADTLFCEWAYVVDLDAGVFEVYAGGGAIGTPQSRFGEAEGVKAGGGPCLVAEFRLGELPTQEEFEATCKSEDDEGDDEEDEEAEKDEEDDEEHEEHDK